MKPASGLDAMNHALYVLSQHDRCSHAPLLRDRAQRNALATICGERVKQAHGGNIDIARQILADFIRSVRQHSKRSWAGPNHYIYARYLKAAVQRILDGDDPSLALGIKSRRGRPKGGVTHNPKALAAAYWLLNRKGLPSEKCVALIRSVTGADRTTVQHARKAPNTAAFGRPGLVTEYFLKSIVSKEKFGKAMLRVLRNASLAS